MIFIIFVLTQIYITLVMICRSYSLILRDLRKFKPAFNFTTKSNSSGSKEQSELLPEHFSQIDIRIGQIIQSWKHPQSDILYCQKIKVLTDPDLIINVASGLRNYVKPQFMSGKVVVMTNLKPRKLAGFESQGMVVCASTLDKSFCEMLVPEGKVGQRIFLQGLQQMFPQGNKFLPVLNPKKKLLQKCLQHLKTDDNGYVTWRHWKLMTKNGYLKSKYPNAIVN